ncbi:MAG: NADH-quinone oxidoreductase subunit A [Ignavibacteria bacterium GWB2_35_12]|nr:MAG: NADH-quinone oxidoreductase subunit A [Ignavibacteria bacterium GWA2_35_8]OGU42336.1 MAG: NADH-quinone oxidoreductase subunit A [Ignavibacteria bacterium GWB2_35_12]OGU96960.1 MAG: NADH-quinone oxidoreductase subunit A [Ignavibacteria bacterium RIFOXYA2_FULL_35_10]OGV18564.1 MAG: NADH-quinone oxidoreductase subunit A [Ignavibacteria bacterium RIFOXYC2_FULL_35_21]
MLSDYVPLIFMVVFGFAIGVVFLVAAELLGARRRTKEKASTYESGMPPVRTARERFSVKFYMVAVLFILFDIEIVFMYPWAVQFKELGSTAFIAMILFIVLLLAGYLYVIRKGALKWD